MNAFYFGTGTRRLFGIYEPARAGSAGPRAAVICNPWGSEYLHAHRSMRQVAIRLSAAGYHTLRFDYFGTGDAAGDLLDADLKGWEADIECALQELKDMSGAPGVTLVGLRLGATLAAVVAAREPTAVDAVVLWDPVVFGSEYLSALYSTSTARAHDKAQPLVPEHGGGVEILGFRLSDAMAQEIRALQLPALIPALPDRTLVIVSEQLASHEILRSAMVGRQAFEHMTSVAPWIENPTNAGVLPVNILQRIPAWLA